MSIDMFDDIDDDDVEAMAKTLLAELPDNYGDITPLLSTAVAYVNMRIAAQSRALDPRRRRRAQRAERLMTAWSTGPSGPRAYDQA
jgi:hypothetical protein